MGNNLVKWIGFDETCTSNNDLFDWIIIENDRHKRENRVTHLVFSFKVGWTPEWIVCTQQATRTSYQYLHKTSFCPSAVWQWLEAPHWGQRCTHELANYLNGVHAWAGKLKPKKPKIVPREKQWTGDTGEKWTEREWERENGTVKGNTDQCWG